jgi:hypothetical protein
MAPMHHLGPIKKGANSLFGVKLCKNQALGPAIDRILSRCDLVKRLWRGECFDKTMQSGIFKPVMRKLSRQLLPIRSSPAWRSAACFKNTKFPRSFSGFLQQLHTF